MKLYKVKKEFEAILPEFSKGRASFDPAHWEKTTLVSDASYIETVNVKCISFSNFIESQNINKLDLLIIDTEGYDFEIIQGVLNTNLRPRIIRFEHGVRNQIMSKSKFVEICRLLNLSGYQIIAESYDAIAYLLDPDDLIF